MDFLTIDLCKPSDTGWFSCFLAAFPQKAECFIYLIDVELAFLCKFAPMKKIRVVLAALFFIGITLLFLDFTGTAHVYLGWMAKVQLLPAILAVNLGVVVALALLTLLLGRVYCSVICPLGVLQDIVSWLSGKRKKMKNRFGYSAEKKWLRYMVLGAFVGALVAGIAPVVALLAPYSAYGRIASNLFAPLYRWGNNLLAFFAERADSYAFYETEVWLRSLPTFLIALATFLLLAVLAWRGGRTYCNTICPVGTLLGCLSRFSLLRPTIDTSKCNGCGLCARRCKASCINSKNHSIDYSRCVVCMDCLENCKQGAITYARRRKPAEETSSASVRKDAPDASKRRFLSVSALFATAAVLKADEKKVDGGLAVIADKVAPKRHTPIVPAGAASAEHFAQHCTACGLCISACPNGVLRPSTRLEALMQPEMSYERGHCRPECVRCSEVCPTGAIKPITVEEKSSTRIGYAVLIKKNCIAFTEGVRCGNCARHCPTGAIEMVPLEADNDNPKAPKIPAINEERCIGCGACENLCPSRPFSAIYVEGREVHSNY